LDPAKALHCWTDKGDSTLYYYADTSGSVEVFGIKRTFAGDGQAIAALDS
jgi:hypothetical protein